MSVARKLVVAFTLLMLPLVLLGGLILLNGLGSGAGRAVAIVAIVMALAATGGIGRIVYAANVDLMRIASELSGGSAQLASAAQEISGSAQLLAQGASEQAASLEETSASAQDIVARTNRNAETSAAAMKMMERAGSRTNESNDRLREMNSTMQAMSASGEKISKIIRTIDEIAFQTNILALNAAVEAARAGEAGQGFAVVADEVRSLAQRAAQAARDTTELIEESIQTSQLGSQKLALVAESINGMTKGSGKFKQLFTELNENSQEQARGLQQITRAVSEMELVTQQTASGAEEAAAAGHELSSQSQTLAALVRSLNSLLHGNEAGVRRQARGVQELGLAREDEPGARRTLAIQRRPAAALSALEQEMANSHGEFVEWGGSQRSM